MSEIVFKNVRIGCTATKGVLRESLRNDGLFPNTNYPSIFFVYLYIECLSTIFDE